MASAHAYSGMYVLAVAARVVDPAEEVRSRTEAEKDLSLLGAGRESQGNWRWNGVNHYNYQIVIMIIQCIIKS